VTRSSLAATFTIPAVSDILTRSAGVMTLIGEITVVGDNPVLIPLDPLQTQENWQVFWLMRT
jgi:hypothetical protein